MFFLGVSHSVSGVLEGLATLIHDAATSSHWTGDSSSLSIQGGELQPITSLCDLACALVDGKRNLKVAEGRITSLSSRASECAFVGLDGTPHNGITPVIVTSGVVGQIAGFIFIEDDCG